MDTVLVLMFSEMASNRRFLGFSNGLTEEIDINYYYSLIVVRLVIILDQALGHLIRSLPLPLGSQYPLNILSTHTVKSYVQVQKGIKQSSPSFSVLFHQSSKTKLSSIVPDLG